MRISMNVPDEVLARVDKEAQYKNLNRTAYFVRAVTEMAKVDAFKRNNPDIERQLLEMQEGMAQLQSVIDQSFDLSL